MRGPYARSPPYGWLKKSALSICTHNGGPVFLVVSYVDRKLQPSILITCVVDRDNEGTSTELIPVFEGEKMNFLSSKSSREEGYSSRWGLMSS